MRLACVIHSLDGGGAERVMAGLASRLAMRGHDVTLLTMDDGLRSRHVLHPAVRWRPMDTLTSPNRHVSVLKRLKTLRGEIVAGQFDCVCSFCDATNVTTLLAMFAHRTPIVVNERSDPSRQSLGRVKEWLRRRLYRNAAQVVCQSEDVAGWLRQNTGTQPIVIPSAVDAPNKLPIRTRSSGDPIRLLAIGRLEWEKGFDRLLVALAKVPQESCDWRLMLCGEGSLRAKLTAQVTALGIADRVSMPGWVSPIDSALADADLFVLPSRYEGFPSALLEAMAYGLPVLAVDAGGGVRQIIDHQRNGWLTLNDDEHLAEDLRRILNDEEMRVFIASHASEVIGRYGWESMVDAYEQVFQSAMSMNQ